MIDDYYDGIVDTGYADGGSGDHNPPEECNDHESSGDSNYPEGFDAEQDGDIDLLAADMASQINALLDSDKREYGAIIWRDSDGNIHSTSIASGEGGEAGELKQVDLGQVWGEIDFANGGVIVGFIHSHPSLTNTGSVENPIWTPLRDSEVLSGVDFDILVSGTNGPGYDQDNFRSYIAQEGDVNEYYKHAQNPDNVNIGGQATYTVESEDYDENVNENINENC